MTDADQLAQIAAHLDRAGVPLEGDAPGGLIPADAASVETVDVLPVHLTVAQRVALLCELHDTSNGIAEVTLRAVERMRPGHTHHCNSRYVHGDGAWCTCHVRDEAGQLATVVRLCEQVETLKQTLETIAVGAVKFGGAWTEKVAAGALRLIADEEREETE